MSSLPELVVAVDKLNVKDTQDLTLDHVISILTQLSSYNDVKDVIHEQIKSEVLLPLLYDLLSDSYYLATKAANVTAEFAKYESFREPFVKHGFIPLLVQLLDKKNTPLTIQVCRALGNICFENDSGREEVDKNNGIAILLHVLQTNISGTSDEVKRLRVIASGYLLNLTNTNESLQLKALEGGALDILCSYLDIHPDDSDLCHMVIASLSCLLDSEFENQEMNCIKTTSTLLKLLDNETGQQYLESSLDLILFLIENDDIKEMVSVSKLPKQLLQAITENQEQPDNNPEPNNNLVTLAADVTVALLRGDKSMQILYNNGDGIVFKESEKWLSSKHEHLEIAGALAVGNFARNDEHCLKLVDTQVVQKMLNLLERQTNSNITLQHACLSALRNLAIPVANKSVMVASGVLTTVLRLTSVDVLPVVFKLLGVVRMLVDGQKDAAIYVASQSLFMEQLIDWCCIEEHAGVKGESTRLLAWLIKNGNSSTVNNHVTKFQGIYHLVSMVTSEHIVMQTEGLLALTLLCHTSLDECTNQLRDAEVAKTLCTTLKQEVCPPEVLYNALALVSALSKNKSIKEEMLEVGIDDIVEKLKSHNDINVSESAAEVSRLLSADSTVT